MIPSEHQRNIQTWWETYGPELVRYARWRLNGVSRAGADAEDMVQEAIAGLLAHPMDVRYPRALLYRAVRMRCSDHVRSNKANYELAVDPQTQRHAPVLDDDHEVRLLIHEALAGLSDSDRTIAVQRLMNGHLITEVADELGVNRITIIRNLPRVIAALRIKLDGLDDFQRIPVDELAARRERLIEEAAGGIGIRRACAVFGMPKSTFYARRAAGPRIPVPGPAEDEPGGGPVPLAARHTRR